LTRLVRRRYLALKIDSEESLEHKAVSDAIWSAVLRLFGEVGASQAGLFMVRSDTQKGHIVLRCWHKALPMVRAAIASITIIGGKPAAVHVLRVSGTLKALSRKSGSIVGKEGSAHGNVNSHFRKPMKNSPIDMMKK